MSAGDPLGVTAIAGAIEDFEPDMLFASTEPGGLTALSMGIPAEYIDRMLSYVLIEGEPIGKSEHRDLLRATHVYTASRYGADVIRKNVGKEVPFAYSGVDHSVFVQDTQMRDDVRKAMRLEDRFVINVTAQNVRRKQLPRLIEAVAHLRYHFKQQDIVLYIHAVPYMGHWLEGWNLPEIAAMYGVSDIVRYHPMLQKRGDSAPEVSGDPENPGLVEMYNASDLFVLPSQVEGFGLPIAEAMACGLPVLVTKYAAGWEVAAPAGRGIPVHDWEIARNGARYGNVDPFELAKMILNLKRDPKTRQRMSKAGLERSRDFSWEPFETLTVQLLEGIHGSQTGSDTPQEADTVERPEAREEVDIREATTP